MNDYRPSSHMNCGSAKKPVQIDPYGCGCTECIIGLYVPLELATGKQIRKMIAGKLSDATSELFEYKDGKIRAAYNNLEWAGNGPSIYRKPEW